MKWSGAGFCNRPAGLPSCGRCPHWRSSARTYRWWRCLALRRRRLRALGSPAFALPNRQRVGGFDERRTFRPTPKLYAQRAVIDACRILVPAIGLLAIGGLGIYLLRRMSDHMDYVRVAGKNSVTLRKSIPKSPIRPGTRQDKT